MINDLKIIKGITDQVDNLTKEQLDNVLKITDKDIERCKELVKPEHSNWIGLSNQKAIQTLLNIYEGESSNIGIERFIEENKPREINIEELNNLADMLDREGKSKDADNIRVLINSYFTEKKWSKIVSENCRDLRDEINHFYEGELYTAKQLKNIDKGRKEYYIHKDKIKTILGAETNDEEALLLLLETIVDENNRLEDIEDRKVQIEYNNVFNKGVESVKNKIKELAKKYEYASVGYDSSTADYKQSQDIGRYIAYIELLNEELLEEYNEENNSI